MMGEMRHHAEALEQELKQGEVSLGVRGRLFLDVI